MLQTTGFGEKNVDMFSDLLLFIVFVQLVSSWHRISCSAVSHTAISEKFYEFNI